MIYVNDNEKMFLKERYIGSDGEDFIREFIEYLGKVLTSTRWEAMSDYTLYLQGAKQAIEEIIEELKEQTHEED